MKKILNFKKENIIAEIEMELDTKGEKNIFSATGTIWEGSKTDRNMIYGGQCLDTIKKYFNNDKLINKIVMLWEKYHLNDMHAGTPKQEKFLKDNNIMGWASNYKNTCNILKENNLYNDNGYIFGSAWLYEAIPQKDLDKIKRIIKKGEMKK